MTNRSGGPLRPWLRVTVVTVMVASMSGAPLDAAPPQRSENADAALVAEFQKRVKGYADLREKLSRTLPSLTDQSPPEDIDQHKRALEGLMTQTQTNAK